MKKPETPQDEQSRVEALRSLDILDSAPEERFDRLTRIAKRLFNVPIALVTLVDANRQWFKSGIGLDVKETPRDISFCGHAVLGSEVFVIPDATEDPRFADNPLVLGKPHVRFYAGCPLIVDGQKLGTLCVIDRVPRWPDKGEFDALRDLAAIAERELAAVRLATIDDLTGLLNRRGFLLLAEQSLNVCRRQGLPASLVYLDLDNFKLINDTLGHHEGDRALMEFADRMKRRFRESDVIGRMGGDEFVALLVDTSKQEAETVVEQFEKYVKDETEQAARGYGIQFSHGITEIDVQAESPLRQLLADADRIMYDAKKAKA